MTAYTTDATTKGARIARNALRLKLWADGVFAHRWICHSERHCADGCDDAGDPARVRFYQSEIER